MTAKFVTDLLGKKIAVIIPIKTYERIVEKLEELEDVRKYDEAMKEDNGKRILFNDYLKKRSH